MLSIFLVQLIPNIYINVNRVIKTLGFFLISFIITLRIDINIIPQLLLFGILISTDLINFLSLNKIKNFLKINITLLSLIFFIGLLSVSSYSHKATYEILNFGAHRNILCEYYACLLAIYCYVDENKAFSIFFHFFGLILCIFFMCKAALLVVCISFVVSFKKLNIVNKKTILKVFIAVCFVYATYNIYNSYLYFYKTDRYINEVKTKTDVLKQFDLIFQINNASGNDRLKIWGESLKLNSIRGNGLGSWKIDYNQNNHGIITRRPHNELLRYITELGVLVLIPLIYFLNRIRYFISIIPLYLFSFPTERPEFILLFILTSLSSKRFLTSQSHTKFKTVLKIVYMVSTIFLLRTAYLQYKLLNREIFFSQLSDIDKIQLQISKRDFLLNRIEIFELMDPLLSNENRLIKTRNLLKSNDPELSKIKKELGKTLKY